MPRRQSNTAKPPRTRRRTRKVSSAARLWKRQIARDEREFARRAARDEARLRRARIAAWVLIAISATVLIILYFVQR